MRITRVLPLTAILLALPMGVMAQDHPPGPPPGGGDHQAPPPGGDHRGPPQDGQRGGPGMMLERLEQLLTIVEAKDGDKDAAELLRHWEETAKERNPEEFKKLDANGDGHLDRAEARAAAEKMQATMKEKMPPDMFARFDANGDGKISRDEIHAARERFQADHPPGDKPPGDRPPGDHPPKHGDDKEPGADPEQERRRHGEDK